MTRNQRRWHRAAWVGLLGVLTIVIGAAMRARAHGAEALASAPAASNLAVRAP